MALPIAAGIRRGRRDPAGMPASLPGLVLDLAVKVNGEDVWFAVLVTGNDVQELAYRVVGNGDGHVGEPVDEGGKDEFLVRHADGPAGELFDVRDYRPLLNIAVANHVESEAVGVVEDSDRDGVVLDQAGERGHWYWGRREDAVIAFAIVVYVTVIAEGVVLDGDGVADGV